MENMIALDPILMAFLSGNLITLGLALKILKEIAKATPWAVDDKVIQIVTGFINRNKEIK